MDNSLMPTGNGINLEDLARVFVAQNQPKPAEGPKFIMAGGKVMGMDNTQPSGLDRLAGGLNSMASNYVMFQQLKKKNDFFKSVNDIMGADMPQEEKRGKMRDLIYQHQGNDYGLGIKDVLLKEQMQPIYRMDESGNMVKVGTVEKDAKVVGGKGGVVSGDKPPSVAQQKFDLAQEEKRKQQESQSELVIASAQDTLDTISEVEKGIGNFGLTGSIPSIPGTARANWEANVNKLLSGKIINLMTEMKNASKTGATGFGQLSNRELAVLQEASTALKRGLSPKDAQRYLNVMKNAAMKVLGDKGKLSVQGKKQYIKIGTYKGKRVGQLPDGTIETINE